MASSRPRRRPPPSAKPVTGPSPEVATAFVERYGRTWESWDVAAFLDLFSEDVVYVAHPTEETVLGREALGIYLRKEQGEQGEVRVTMGRPIVDGDHVAAEFWVTAVNRGREATIAGCLLAQLDADGRCTRFREYWFDVEGHAAAPSGWGE
jgi:ketosteroid isomerase-like protein